MVDVFDSLIAGFLVDFGVGSLASSGDAMSSDSVITIESTLLFIVASRFHP